MNIVIQASVKMPDPVLKLYGQLWPLRPVCGQSLTGSYISDPISYIRFGSVPPKKAQIIIVVRFLGKRILSGSKPVCKTHRAWLWQSATDPLPVSHFQDRYSVHPQMARIILRKTRPDPIWFWLTVSGLGQTYPVRKQAGVRVFWPVP